MDARGGGGGGDGGGAPGSSRSSLLEMRTTLTPSEEDPRLWDERK